MTRTTVQASVLVDVDPTGVFEGDTAIVRFTLSDGSVIEVDHKGDHIEVRNLGERATSGLSVIPLAFNSVLVVPS